MNPASDTVTVRVPGSTSNCGAGFDTLGLALTVYNRVTLTRAAGTDPLPASAADARATTMVSDTASLVIVGTTPKRGPSSRKRSASSGSQP